MVIELRVFKKKKMNMGKINTHVKFSLHLIFCVQFIFDVFSTVISPKDVLIETECRKLEFPYVWYEFEVGTTIAIPIYTVLPYCVI